MTTRPVVVTGLGFVTCLGNDAGTVSSNLKGLRHGIRPYPPFASADLPVKLAAPIPGFQTESADPEDWVYPDSLRFRLETLRGLSPNALYALFAMEEALRDARLSVEEISHPRTGLYTASVGSALRLYHNLDRLKKVGPQRCSPLGIVASVAGTLSFNLVAYYRIKGCSTGFVSACASSGHALGSALDQIALGRQDRMLVVGAEDFNPETILPFVSMRVLTASTDPERASRPFDRDRDGFVGTGGAVVMVLEEEGVARARGAPAYARFSGWGHSTDGYHVAASHPEGEGLARAMQGALEHAGVSPEAVEYVNAHATSTPIGDVSELRAIKRVFGTGEEVPWVSSTKALTGHALSLSSIMEAAFCCLAMREGFIPGSAHIENLDPEAEGVRIARTTLPQRPQVVLSNSSGFGGANVSLLFRSV